MLKMMAAVANFFMMLVLSILLIKVFRVFFGVSDMLTVVAYLP